MSSKYNNLFVGVYNSVKGTPLSAWLLILSVILLLIGTNNFAEDTYSSYVGIQMLEQTFGINPATWQLTYWAMSLFFQVIAVISFFIYLSDRKANWGWFWLAVGSQIVDFMADVWYRSDQGLFESPAKFFVSLLLTFIFFTAGSELAVTVGFGLVATMFKDGFTQFGNIVSGLIGGIVGAGQAIAGGKTLVDEHEKVEQLPRQEHKQQWRERTDISPEARKALERFRNPQRQDEQNRPEPQFVPVQMNMQPTPPKNHKEGGKQPRQQFQRKHGSGK